MISKPYYSVTEILAGVVYRNNAVSTPALEFGKNMHKALELYILSGAEATKVYIEDKPNAEKLKESVKNCVKNMQEFLGDFSKYFYIIEKRSALDYGEFFVTGKPDVIAISKQTKERIVLDFKSDSNIFASLNKYTMQLSAYAEMFNCVSGVVIPANYHTFIEVKGAKFNKSLKIFKEKAMEFHKKCITR